MIYLHLKLRGICFPLYGVTLLESQKVMLLCLDK